MSKLFLLMINNGLRWDDNVDQCFGTAYLSEKEAWEAIIKLGAKEHTDGEWWVFLNLNGVTDEWKIRIDEVQLESNLIFVKDHHHADLSNKLRDALYPRITKIQSTRDVVSRVISDWRNKHSPTGVKINGVEKCKD